ncbi:uncharacterized protein PFL1_02993 [Pseudozyma flocculosa PF-1]|uniref:Hyaluronan-mediated motility receptor C-terminal domain-containing protein n=1 Tax=Pseudozyma flocculosa PF-1 TaxID=1277687 RepID=A0A061H9C5_9BASI|nr:uncharacterized protein PFL1_02993 [Pseudozyma flocculosa PF-1]EPQ29238.1 hypothetical protein PFL1_02993 [Pseudozyma flocculosa PF-1]
MFSKAPRFPQRPPDEIPGPNSYDPTEPQAHWKQGVFPDHAATQPRKASSSAANGDSRRVLSSSTKANMPPSATASATATATTQQKHLAKLEQHLARATSTIDDLTHARTQLENEKTDLATELRLAQQREAKLKATLEKSERASAGLKEKSTRYNDLQARLEELQKLHAESKDKRARENKELSRALDAEREKRKAADEHAENLEAEAQRCRDEVRAERERGEKASEQQLARLRKLENEVEGHKQTQARLREQLHQSEQHSAQLVKTLDDERRTLRQASEREQQDLEHRVEELQALLQQAAAGRDEVRLELQDAEAEHEREEAVRSRNLELVARAAGLALAQQKQQADEEKADLRTRLLAAQREELRVRFVAQERMDQIQELVQVVRQVQDDRDAAKAVAICADGDLASLLQERRLDRPAGSGAATESTSEDDGDGDSCGPQDALSDEDDTDALDRLFASDAAAQALEEARFELSIQASRTAQLQDEIAHLHDTLLDTAREHKTTLSTLSQLRAQLDAAVADSAARQAQVDALAAQVGQGEKHRQRLEEALDEMAEARRQLKVQVEANKGLASALSNAKVAEAALVEERNSLTTTVVELEAYREEYERLCTQTRVLVDRHALAETERHALTELTTSLLRHTNPAQKIVYLDRIRRQLDEVQAENVEIKVELERERAWRVEMEAELRMYKAVDAPLSQRQRRAPDRGHR